MDTELMLPETLAEAHAVIRELQAAVQALRERVAELEMRLGPPSTDPPWTPPPAPAKRQPSGRKSGGQPGHVAHQRELLPPVQVTVTEYQLQRVRLSRLWDADAAGLPPGVPMGAFGPRLPRA